MDTILFNGKDVLLDVGYDEEKAKGLIKRYQEFIKDHQNELDAIQVIYAKPFTQRHLSYEKIEELAEEIKQPPYNIAPLEALVRGWNNKAPYLRKINNGG